MLIISLAKRFAQKSSIFRFVFTLKAISKFHFHGVKFLRFLKFYKVFCTYFLSFSRNFWVELSIKGTSFFRSVIWAFKNINQRLFYFSSNTYPHGLPFSANETFRDYINFSIYNSSKKYIHT